MGGTGFEDRPRHEKVPHRTSVKRFKGNRSFGLVPNTSFTLKSNWFLLLELDT